MTTIASGNRCGHDPHNPVLSPGVELHKKAPVILKDMIERVRAFYAVPDSLPFLNNEDRQRRSESREAIVQVTTILLKHLDLVTMKVVRMEQGKPFNVDLRYLHSQTNLSFSRFKRAWLALIDAGVIKSFKQHEKQESGDYKGLPSIKVVSPLFFAAAGLSKRLKAARDYLSEKLRLNKIKTTQAARAAKRLIEQANSARVKKAIGKSLKDIMKKTYAPKPKPKPKENNHINSLLANASWNKQ